MASIMSKHTNMKKAKNTSTNKQDLDRLYIQAMQQYQQSGLAAGRRTHDKLRQVSPGSRYDDILTGVAFSCEGHVEEALAAYNRAIEKGPDTLGSVFILKAEALAQLKRYDEAIATLDKSIALAPNNISSYEAKAIFLLEIDHLSDVPAVYDTLLRKRSHSIEIFLFQSLAHFLLGQVEQAWSVHRQIFSLLPDPSMLPMFQDNMLSHLTQYKERINQYRQNHLQQADGWYFSGLILLIEGQPSGPFEEALRAFMRAIDLDSKHAWAWNGVGMLRMGEESPEAAERAFAQAATLLPTIQSFAQNRKKAMRVREGKNPSHAAASQQKRGATASSDLEVPPLELMMQLMNEERFDEALQACEQLISVGRIYPDKVNLEVALWLKARLLYDLHRVDEAIGQYRAVLGVNPTHPHARSELFDILVMNQQFNEALEILADDTGEQREDESLFHRKRAGVLLILQRNGEALESANHAHMLNPGDLSTVLIRIEAMRQLGHSTPALLACEEALPTADQRERAFPLLLLAQADLYVELGRPREALPIYEEALRREQNKRKQRIEGETGALLEGFGPVKGDVVALILGGMGNAWLLLKDATKAIVYYDQALALGANEAFEANRNRALVLFDERSKWRRFRKRFFPL